MMQPFQELIGRTVICAAADLEKRGISFATADGSWLHYALANVVKFAHIDNAANLNHGEVLGVQAITQMVADNNTVECIVNFDIRDQPECIIRFEIDLSELARKKEAVDWLVANTDKAVSALIPLKEDF